MSLNNPGPEDEYPERLALIRIDPPGTHIRHPPPPHELDSYITPDSKLFQTIHMGSAVVDSTAWRLVITGLVDHPFSLTLPELTAMDAIDVTSFHECYGPPTAKPIKNYLRIGNVTWTGVRLATLLQRAGLQAEAKYIWSEGLDHGEFAGHRARRFQKDLTLSKAMSEECLVAWAMNGQPLSKERGGPVRLVVPGWFGTNSTKWLCRLEVRDRRAEGTIFTTRFYNEIDPKDREGKRMRPVWEVEVNSMIARPKPGEVVEGREVRVEGWCWSVCPVESLELGFRGGAGEDAIEWKTADVRVRECASWHWQRFWWSGPLGKGQYTLVSRAKDGSGDVQPMTGRRNHVHEVAFEVG